MSKKENYISVSGYGRLFVDPNYIKISTSLKCLSQSLKSSLASVNSNMKQLFDIMDQNKVERNLVHVVDLTFGPEYKRNNATDVMEFQGYAVNQKVSIEMDATKENEDKAVKIIGEVATLCFLTHCDVEYGLKNKKMSLETVRELSFKNALEKAEQYASLAGLRIIKANTISDRGPVGQYSRTHSNSPADEPDYDSDSYLPNGRKIVLENVVDVKFDIDK